MRLICPNCDAEYEVEDSAIPLAGRDVQCSNCGTVWFQRHPDAPAPATPPPPPAALPGEDAAPPALPPDEDVALADDLPPPSSRLDAVSLAMLKEEAARELAARRAAAPAPIEVQGDLGLPPPPPPAPAAPPVATPAPGLAAPPGFPDPAVVAAAVATDTVPAPTRRSRLPDIEEINSTLRPQGFPPGHEAALAAEDEADVDPAPAGSFRAGFLLIIGLAVALTLLYIFAPQLAAAVPALEGPLAAYVQTVDAMRLWLDGALRGLIDSLRGLAAPPAG